MRPDGRDPVLPLRGDGGPDRAVPRHARRDVHGARLGRDCLGPRAGSLPAVALRALTKTSAEEQQPAALSAQAPGSTPASLATSVTSSVGSNGFAKKTW